MKCSQTAALLWAVFLTARCDKGGEVYESENDNQLTEGQMSPENQPRPSSPGRSYYPNNIQPQYFLDHHRYNMHHQPTTQQHNIQDFRPAPVGPSSKSEESHITNFPMKQKETEKGPEIEDQERQYPHPKLPSNISPQMMQQQKPNIMINAGGPTQSPRINPQSMLRNQMEQPMMMPRPMRMMAVTPQPFMNQPFANHQPFMNHPPQQPFMNHPPQQPIMNHPPQQPFMNHPPQQPQQHYTHQQPHISHYTQQTQQMNPVPQQYISHPPHQPQNKDQPTTGAVIQNTEQPPAATKQRYASQPWQHPQRYPPYEGYEHKA